MMTTEAVNINIPVPGIIIKRITYPYLREMPLPTKDDIKLVPFERSISEDLPLPLDKWTMPSEPDGYIKHRENDCL